jgi:hypothetical protein
MTSDPDGKDPAVTRAQVVKDRHERDLLQKANVVGVGIGLRQRAGVQSREVAIVVLVERKVPRSQLAPDDFVPSMIDGVPVDIQEVGEIRAL